MHVGLAFLALAVPWAASTSGQDNPPSAFNRACATCHGPAGRGSELGPALVPLAYDFAQLTGIVRQGVGYMASMTRSEVSDPDLEQIYSYLESLDSPAARDVTASPASSGGPNVEDIRSQIDRARRANDLDGLAMLAEQARRAAFEIDLAAAYATWAQVSQSPAPTADSAARLDEAIGRIELAFHSNEPTADTRAFLAALYALRQSLSRAPEPALGVRIESELSQARSLDPDNPRVAFLGGVAATLAPEAAGGWDAAERELRRAQESLSEPAPIGVWPAWNAADASAWLGRLLYLRGDAVGARRAYEKALELDPNYVWVTRVLLPMLGRLNEDAAGVDDMGRSRSLPRSR